MARTLGLLDKYVVLDADIEALVQRIRSGARTRRSPAREALIDHRERIAEWLSAEPPLLLREVHE